MAVKQIIIIRKDLGMRRGKEISQGAHAAMAFLSNRMVCRYDALGWAPEFYGTAPRLSEAEQEWLLGSFRKITVRVDSAEDLADVVQKAKDASLVAEVITDSGLTEFGGVPTVTCAAIGPDYDEKIDPVTGHLELY
jgi:PTH2 family peptidyl-tRNA hydrolase